MPRLRIEDLCLRLLHAATRTTYHLFVLLPFALFAMFPNMLKALPKSGGWLNTTKVVLGFLELALAFKFLSNADLVQHWGLLKIEVFLGIWILVFFGLVSVTGVIVLMGLDRLPSKYSHWRIVNGLAILAADTRRVFLSPIHSFKALSWSLLGHVNISLVVYLLGISILSLIHI